MGWVKFSVAVVLTSVALVIALFATGAFMVGNAVASSIHTAAQAHGSGLDGHNMPPELANLKDIPPAERFSHFKGVQVSLTDKDGKPVDIAVTPGVASSVSATSLTIAGNDGAARTYALDSQTFSRGPVAAGDNVVVVTLDNASTARAVLSTNPANWHHS
jgi:hypothetical protein